MDAFDELQAQISAHRDEHEALRTEALLAADAARRAEQRVEHQARIADEDDPDALRLLETERDEAIRGANAAKERLSELRGAGLGLNEAFAAFSDPTEGLARLTDQHPILLFPLRLETRFKPSATGQPQLWVRVYPDTCLVDGFEASLTETEVSSGTTFWAAVWRAGGDEPMERSAWRELVASIGSGRAGWVVRQLVPANPVDKPERHDASDVLLVVVANTPLPDEVKEFWTRVWRAAGDPTETQNARAWLEGKIGAVQAADIIEHHRPVNMADEPTPPRTRVTTRVDTAVAQLDSVDDLDARRTSWSSAPPRRSPARAVRAPWLRGWVDHADREAQQASGAHVDRRARPERRAHGPAQARRRHPPDPRRPGLDVRLRAGTRRRHGPALRPHAQPGEYRL